MKIERTKNAGRNILFGSILKIYQMIIPFVMRTVMIYFMGVEYLGLNSLFTSILQVLELEVLWYTACTSQLQRMTDLQFMR